MSCLLLLNCAAGMIIGSIIRCCERKLWIVTRAAYDQNAICYVSQGQPATALARRIENATPRRARAPTTNPETGIAIASCTSGSRIVRPGEHDGLLCHALLNAVASCASVRQLTYPKNCTESTPLTLGVQLFSP